MNKAAFLIIVLATTVTHAQWPGVWNYGEWNEGRAYDQTPPLSPQELYARRLSILEARLAYERQLLELAIQRRELALYRAERLAYMKEKEANARGITPVSKFIYDGVDYGTFDNFKQTPAFTLYLAEIEARRAPYEAAKEDRRRQEAVAYWRLANWRPSGNESPKDGVIRALKLDLALGVKTQAQYDAVMKALEAD